MDYPNTQKNIGFILEDKINKLLINLLQKYYKKYKQLKNWLKIISRKDTYGSGLENLY